MRFPGKQLTEKLPDKFDLVLFLRIGRLSPESKPERVLQTKPDIDPQYCCKDRSGTLNDFEKPDLSVILNKVFSIK